LAAKGTIRNKEVFNRNYFEKLQDVDLGEFMELVDAWRWSMPNSTRLRRTERQAATLLHTMAPIKA